LEARWKARVENKLENWKPSREIKQPPKNFTDWIDKNQERIENAKHLPYWIKDNAKFVSLRLNEISMVTQQLFITYKEFSNSGGRIEIMQGYEKKSDHKDLFAIARIFAEKGDKVQITTDVHFKDKKYNEVFGALNGTPYKRKCPDLIVNGKFYEYERYMAPFKKEKISHMIKKGSIQSSRIIINNNKGASDRYIRRNIIERINDKNFKYDIDEVWLYEKGKVRLLFKKQ
jgi:hypothetical protein